MYHLDAPGTSTSGTSSQFGEYRGMMQSCIPLQSETINNRPNTETMNQFGATTQNESSQFGVYLSALNCAPSNSSLFLSTKELEDDTNEANKVDGNTNRSNLFSFGQPPVGPHPPPPPPPPPPPSIFGAHPHPPPPPPPPPPSTFGAHPRPPPPPPPSIFGAHPGPSRSIFHPRPPVLQAPPSTSIFVPRPSSTPTRPLFTAPSTEQQTGQIQRPPPPAPPLPPGGIFGTPKSTGTSLFDNSRNTSSNLTTATTTTGFGGFGASRQYNGLFSATSNSTGFSFGQAPQQNNNFSLFGTQTNNATPALFGLNQNYSSFNGTAIVFRPTHGSDTINKNGAQTDINTSLQAITGMQEYEKKSFEELRKEDYDLNIKYGFKEVYDNHTFGPPRSLGLGTVPITNYQNTGFGLGGFNNNIRNENFYGFKQPSQVFESDHVLMNANYLANSKYTNDHELFKVMAQVIENETPLKPVIAIICDSNMASLSEKLRNRFEIPYTKIPNFLYDNKNGKFVFGTIKDVPVVCMACRFNASEKYTSAACTMPIRFLKHLGVKIIITTSVCESISKFNEVGDILIVKDHASLPLSSLQNPLIGLKDADKLNLNAIYSKDIREIFKIVGKYDGIYFNECVYGGCGGPTSETIAGVKLMQLCGANVIGLNDIINEAMMSAYCKIKVLGLVVVTNIAISEYDTDQKKNYDEISNIPNEKINQIGELISKFIGKLDDDKLL